ncbi:MAG: hypothetical protein AAGA77_11545 [Bacteroidota bacterium]
MIYSILIAAALLLSGKSYDVHEVAIAVFTIEKKDHNILLELTFDRDDYLEYNHLQSHELTLAQVEIYLNENLNISFDGETCKLLETKLIEKNPHVLFSALLRSDDGPIKNIEIQNTFLNSIEGHSNIVMIDMHGISKDYRMHRERTKIIIAL